MKLEGKNYLIFFRIFLFGKLLSFFAYSKNEITATCGRILYLIQFVIDISKKAIQFIISIGRVFEFAISKESGHFSFILRTVRIDWRNKKQREILSSLFSFVISIERWSSKDKNTKTIEVSSYGIIIQVLFLFGIYFHIQTSPKTQKNKNIMWVEITLFGFTFKIKNDYWKENNAGY